MEHASTLRGASGRPPRQPLVPSLSRGQHERTYFKSRSVRSFGKLGDAFIVTATDFPHGDAFRQDQLANGLKARGDLSAPTMEKILTINPQRLYHI